MLLLLLLLHHHHHHHPLHRSDLYCCDEHKYDSYGDDRGAADIVTPQLRVGTCDWDVDIYKCTETNNQGCSAEDGWAQPMAMENGAFKLGTAWGTCECSQVVIVLVAWWWFY